jgi:NAD+ kinase
VKRFGIIGHLDRPLVGEAAERIIGWSEENGIEIRICDDLATLLNRGDLSSDSEEIGNTSDIIISLGGDGSILSSALVAGMQAIPILGVNLGSLGFLTEITQDQIIESLDKLREGKFRIEERMILEMSLSNEPGNGLFALNDIVIDHGESTNIIQLELFANDEFVSSYNADGIIISTPTGSTAYSLSVGGPIISPMMDAIAVSPISPHTLTLRPIIFPASDVLMIRAGDIRGKLRVSVDGRIAGTLEGGRKIRIRRGERKMKLIRFGTRSFYSVLRKKLHWGKRPLMNN